MKSLDPSGARPDISPVEYPVNVAAVCLAGEAVKGAGWICFKHLPESVGLKGLKSG